MANSVKIVVAANNTVATLEVSALTLGALKTAMAQAGYSTNNVEFILKESRTKLIDDRSTFANNAVIYVVVAQTKNAAPDLFKAFVQKTERGTIAFTVEFDPAVINLYLQGESGQIAEVPVEVPRISAEDQALLDEALAFMQSGTFSESNEDSDNEDSDDENVW